MSTAVPFPVQDPPSLRADRSRIFVLESNTVLLDYIRKTLGDRFALSLFSEEASLVRELESTPRPDMMLLAWDGVDYSLPMFSRLLDVVKNVPTVLLSCTAEIDELAPVIRMGAQGFVLKPFAGQELEEAVGRYLAPKPVETVSTNDAQEVPIGEGRYFVRSSKRMRDVEIQASLVARSDIPVLILGESGTGKEVIAMYVHKMSHRANNTFLKVNCAAMPADLLESELFGYEQGAFTGAYKSKPGKFEICSGGTIFLDEIGEMPALLQAKLLHVLQDGTFSRLGSRAPMKADVRVVAATNVNLKEAMANKTFREDLYYRLNGFSLHLPPLRERREEIKPLAEYFMRRSAERYRREPLPFSPVLLSAMQQYSWPGNLRELENVINRYLILGDERAILSELTITSGSPSLPSSQMSADATGDGTGLKGIVRSLKGDAEAAAIASALEETRWNRKAAAQNLKISYKALLYKIKNYGLEPGKK